MYPGNATRVEDLPLEVVGDRNAGRTGGVELGNSLVGGSIKLQATHRQQAA